MKIDVYRSGLIPQHVFETVSKLLHNAFAERREQGINFKCGLFSAQDVENEFINRGGYLLLAINENEQIVGTVSLIERNKGGFRYVSHDNLAVSSLSKGKGVASSLFQEVLNVARREGYDFITSFTATTADSSVRYHLKNGFVIYEMTSGKGYDSYSFIYPLRRFGFMRIKPLSKMIYVMLTFKRRIKNLLR